MRGRVAVGAVGAAAVPVMVTLDGRNLGQVQTDGAGRFTLETGIVPADGPGRVEVEAAVALEGRALGPGVGSDTVSVRTSATRLLVNATQVSGREIRIQGRLLTEDGLGVGNEQVAIEVNGTGIDTVTTGTDGRLKHRWPFHRRW
jgi:hypothetical protein